MDRYAGDALGGSDLRCTASTYLVEAIQEEQVSENIPRSRLSKVLPLLCTDGKDNWLPSSLPRFLPRKHAKELIWKAEVALAQRLESLAFYNQERADRYGEALE